LSERAQAQKVGAMTDVIFVALMIGFFALAVGLVKLCERIVGGAELATLESPEAPGPTPQDETGMAA
jgi:hypothetical protein